MSIIEKAAKRLAEKQGKAGREVNRGKSKDEFPQDSGRKRGAAVNPFSDMKSEQEAASTNIHGNLVGNTGAQGNPFESWEESLPAVEGGNGQAVGKKSSIENRAAVSSDDLVNRHGNVGDDYTPSAAGQGFHGAGPENGNFISVTELEKGLLLSPEGGRSRTAEEFRMIKRPLLVNAFDAESEEGKHPNLIMITSAVQGEGKSFTSLNLAISITMEMDSTVLLVDGDVAKPGLSRILGLSEKSGLIEYLTDEYDDIGPLLFHTDIPKLTVLPAGQTHKRSTELLASNRMGHLLDEMAQRYPDRIVLLDSPPLLETTEASVLAAQMGQVVLVVESESTSQMLVKEAIAQLENMDNVYIILNKCKTSLLTSLMSGKYSGYTYGYGYSYGYGYGSEK